MEHGVDGAKAIWEAKCDRVGAWLCYDLVWSHKLISKLLRGTGSTEKLHLDIGLTPDQEFQSWGSMSISSTLILELCCCHVLS